MEKFCDVTYSSSDQHVDSRESRITKDVADEKKMSEFFANYNPFPVTDKLMSIFSGVIGGNSMNCYMAEEIGLEVALSLLPNNFGTVKFPRKNKVISLKTVLSSVKLNDVPVAVHPYLLFERIYLNVKVQTEMEELLKYELAPFPMSLLLKMG